MKQLNLVSLATVRAVVLVLVALTLVFYAVALPYQFWHSGTICAAAPKTCPNDQLIPGDLPQLQQAGLSLQFYAGYTVALDLVFVIVWLAVAGLIFWRRPDDVMALFTALMLAMFPTAGFSTPYIPLAGALPQLQPLINAIRLVGQLCIVLFFFLFPDGKFTPRWAAGLFALAALRETLNVYSPQLLGWDYYFIFELLALMGVQVYRYRRTSNPVQRQQTKWVVFGSVTALAGFTGTIYIGALFLPSLHMGGVLSMVLSTFLDFWLLLVPFSIGMAILRSHLWDIDLIIRRTLGYGALTLLLGLAYGGAIIVLQGASHALTGVSQSPVVVVLSTLAIILLFDPLRRHVQRVIDRRFFRSSYDAEQVLARFRAAARSEVALDRLSADLLVAIEDSVHPQAVSLWVVKKER